MAHPGVKDPFRAKAKKEGYSARSVYKLKEIQQRYHLLQTGALVADLGCHPGSWLQFCSQTVGPRGRVLGIDLKAPTAPGAANVAFLQADIRTLSREQLPPWARQVDVVLSDLAPNTTGVKWLDHERSLELARKALETARGILKPGGGFLVKIFQGEGFDPFRRDLETRFQRVALEKPRSSRSESREVYLIGLGYIKN
ncbi:MAG: RlmE family RNA methyltransferase [Deltaproteobacteria bacterium]|nr:RlmE family RNA methyltransferase [Deltaproteobacteria bacterium]